MKLFNAKPRPATVDAGTGGVSPYVDAQRVWLERYGSYLQAAHNWRLIAMLEAIALIVAILGLAYVAAQTKFIPYVVAVDKIGEPIGVQVADHAAPVDQRVLRAELANWISNARSVVTDRIVEKSNLDNVYAMIADGSAARGYIDHWYPNNGHSPFDRAASQTVTVSIDSLLPLSAQTWQAQWTETIRDLSGNVTSTEQWVGSIGIAIKPPTDEATILRNPLGVYVTTLDWTKKL